MTGNQVHLPRQWHGEAVRRLRRRAREAQRASDGLTQDTRYQRTCETSAKAWNAAADAIDRVWLESGLLGEEPDG